MIVRTAELLSRDASVMTETVEHGANALSEPVGGYEIVSPAAYCDTARNQEIAGKAKGRNRSLLSTGAVESPRRAVWVMP